MPAYPLYPTVAPQPSSTSCPSLGAVWIFWIFENHLLLPESAVARYGSGNGNHPLSLYSPD